MADKALDNDKHWQYNKNFIDWAVGVTKKSVEEGGLCDEAIAHIKTRTLDSIIRFKDGAKLHQHRAKHLLDAIRIVRGLQ